MKENHSYDVSGCTVGELIGFLQSLPKSYRNWPIHCCGSDQFFLCFNEEEGYIVADMDDLFESYDDEWDDAFS